MMNDWKKVEQAIGLARAKGVSGKKIQRVLAGFGLTMASVSAFAAGPDMTPLTSGVDFSTIIAGILAVATLGVGYVLAKGGAAGIVSFIKRMAHG